MTAFALVNDDIAASLHGSGCTSNRSVACLVPVNLQPACQRSIGLQGAVLVNNDIPARLRVHV